MGMASGRLLCVLGKGLEAPVPTPW